MGWNTPDDWDMYYRTCHLCGNRYHASEYYCDCGEECFDCKELFLPAYLEDDQVTGDALCEDCLEMREQNRKEMKENATR